jgi:hypothetical protein
MTTRRATCSCGQLRVEVDGDPFRISICHCLACQRRTGSAFGFQARFRAEDGVRIEGASTQYRRVSDDGLEHVFSFCPDCGSTVHWRTSNSPETVAVAVGAFADPGFPDPWVSVWEARRHSWLELPETMKHEAE